MTGSKATGIVLALICIALACLPAAAHGALTPWRLDPRGGWEPLEPVNPYATIQGGNPVSGWGNAGSSAVQITARAEVAFDVNRAELTADFAPTSREIIESDPRLFVSPLGRRLEWKVILTVRNPNDIPMHGAKVQGSFGPAFRATLSGRSQGDARIAGEDPRGMLPMDASFVWDVGDLGPNEAARAEISVVTRRDSSGRQEFAQEGVYPVDSGFKLTYSLLGKAQVRNTSPCSVIARVNPEALRPDGGPYDVAQKPIEQDWPFPERPFLERPVPVRPGLTNALPVKLGVGGNVPIGGGQGGIAPSVSVKQSGELAHITRVHGTGMFKVIATGLSDNIGVEDDKFTVPAGEAAEWKVEIWVENPYPQSPSVVQPQGQPEGWNGFIVTLPFGADLAAEEIGRSVYVPGNPDIHDGVLKIVEDYPAPGITRIKVIWDWHQEKGYRFLPGSKAYLSLKVTTGGLPPSSEDLVFCGRSIEDPINMEYNPVGSGYWHQVPLDQILIKSAGEPHADVSVTATRIDWRVRKPGTYAALATTVTASGIGTLSMQFSEFADLLGTDGVPGAIAAFYGFGDDLAAAEAGRWISAADLNNTTRHIDLSEPEPVLMWSKISVGEEVSSAEYENEGVITFIVSNTQIGEGN